MTDDNNKNDLEPRIYVACLAAYNSGYLHGRWIDAAQSEDDILQAVSEMLAASPVEDAEEWAIHDYDNFGGVRLSEWESFAAVSEQAFFLVEHGEVGALALNHYDDVGAACTALTEYYQGQWNSVADYAMYLTEEIVMLGNIPENICFYIDYEAMADDMLYRDDIFTLADEAGYLHIFTSHYN